jgi:hypothetical protein
VAPVSCGMSPAAPQHHSQREIRAFAGDYLRQHHCGRIRSARRLAASMTTILRDHPELSLTAAARAACNPTR